MRSQIPRPIKIKVLRKWLHGQSRREIAKGEGISTGTVSNIIKEYRQNDSGFDLLRQVAIILRSQGYSIESFAPLVRIREKLRRELLLLLLSEKTATDITIARRKEHDGNLKTQQVREELELEEKLESVLGLMFHLKIYLDMLKN